MNFIINRVNEQKSKFEEEFRDELFEQSISGFVSLLALGHDPTDEEA